MSADISFRYCSTQGRAHQFRSRGASFGGGGLLKIFNLLQVVVSSTSVVLLHGVSRWDNPATPAAVLPLVIAHTGAPSLS